MAAAQRELTIRVTDVADERQLVISNVPADATVGELVQSLVVELGVPRSDVHGRSYSYHARLEREGRHLHASEIVGEVLETDDKLILQPHITAGGW